MGNLPAPKLIPISVTQFGPTTIIVYKEVGAIFSMNSSLASSLRVATSGDGVQFKLHPELMTLARTMKNEKIDECSNIRLSVVGDEYVLSYEKKTGTTKTGIKKEVVVTRSKNLTKFKIHKNTSRTLRPDHSGLAVHLGHTGDRKNKFAFYYGSPTITVAESADLETWTTNNALLLSPRSGFFDHGQLSIVAAHSIPEGIAILYQTRAYENGKEQILVGGALFAHDNPQKIVWRSELPLWEHEYEKSTATDTNSEALWRVCGAVFKKDSILIYLVSRDGDLSVVAIPNRFHTLSTRKQKPPSHITRYSANPIIEPDPHHDWQSQATFNPAALEVDGRIHLLYRAMGGDGVSRVGHSSSPDGVHFDRRSSEPVFEPSDGFGLPPGDEKLDSYDARGHRHHEHISNLSGGAGWAGSEDPRAVQIGNRIYMTYVAFEGWNSVRIALTSISVHDFKKEKWNWRRPTHLSAAGEVHKNWVLFPEKINGKFAILHGITPRVRIEYVDNLDDLGENAKAGHKIHIKSQAPSGGRKYHWDNRVRGAGPPPIKTRIGWLLLYHATDAFDLNKYKIGAMILDINDPTRILYRSPEPILTPEMSYENDWKPGVIYASGAVVNNGNLLVYYGGGDKHVCLAETPLDPFLDWLVKYGKVI